MKIKEGFTGQRSVVVPQIILDQTISDPLLQALRITAMGYYPKAENHFRVRNQPIDDYVMIYCVDGEGWFDINGERHSVSPNSFFILPAGLPHSYGADETLPWTIYWIHFQGYTAESYVAMHDNVIPVRPTHNSRIQDRNNLFEEIFLTLDRGLTSDSIRYTSALFHHYLASLRFLKEYRGVTHADDQDSIVNATIHYLEENAEKNLTLKQISEYSGYSASYLSSVFKSQTGYGPLTYFNLIKIRQACRMLADTDMKINSICHKVGISDPYYFSRLFSKVIGMSPSEYRRRSEI